MEDNARTAGQTGSASQELGATFRSAPAAATSGDTAVRLRKFPYPYSAAATVSSDIDDANHDRFASVHALFCGTEIIRPGTFAWTTLGLTEESPWYEPSAGGVPGLGLEFGDTFFLIANPRTLGMYRRYPDTGEFREDSSDGRNACEAIKEWLRRGEMDAFHGFHAFTRDQVLPLLERFYRWCEEEGIPKPSTWINHSWRSCPTGLCPSALRPNPALMLFRQIARYAIGPILGRRRKPIVWRQRWYQGAVPGSPYYINDVLHANGLKYVWLEADRDELANVISLPERRFGDRSSLLEPVTMDDGISYYRFRRCYGKVNAPRGVVVALRTSPEAFDASALFTNENLDHLCDVQGTCILYTHWTVPRSLPVQDETIGNFERLRRYRDAGKIWVPRLSRLLEWTRLRTFLRYSSKREGESLIINIEALEDPLFGRQRLMAEECEGLAFDLPPDFWGPIAIRVGGQDLLAGTIRREASVCWIGKTASKMEGSDPLATNW